jgi:succinyl-CoA synthetase beta subunit
LDLYEYQAKQLFAKHGVPTQAGAVVTTPDEAFTAATTYGVPVVIKAQVKTGGRGKAGGVKLAQNPTEAREKAQQILGMDIKGHTVYKVLVTPAEEIKEEYYASILVDRSQRKYLAMLSLAGGVDIEEVAAKTPEKLAKVLLDPLMPLSQPKAIELARRAGLADSLHQSFADLFLSLWRVFSEEDALLVEVNPLALIADGRLIALDGKVTIDDNALFRHPEDEEFADPATADPLEMRAHEKGLHYVKLEGDVGVIGNGAGLVMSTLDVVSYAGESRGGAKPANFLDIGGGASAQVMADGLEIVLSDPQVKAVFINVFGGITACDAVANGIVEAVNLLGSEGKSLSRPIVVRLDGNNAELGRDILGKANIAGIELVDTMDSAAERVAELARKAA